MSGMDAAKVCAVPGARRRRSDQRIRAPKAPRSGVIPREKPGVAGRRQLSRPASGACDVSCRKSRGLLRTKPSL
ncbi:hypothetical protein B5S52_09270 [Pectobacterium brasiliense]|nr:hypothetical protein B5S52_09270 [Pectobacterium brasiliense]